MRVIVKKGFGLFQVPNNRNMFLSAPRGRSAAAGGLQGTARLAGQTGGAIVMSLLFSMTSIAAAPRLGLLIGAVLTLAAGLVSLLRTGAAPAGPDVDKLGRTIPDAPNGGRVRALIARRAPSIGV